jgi:hypothetical protein
MYHQINKFNVKLTNRTRRVYIKIKLEKTFNPNHSKLYSLNFSEACMGSFNLFNFCAHKILLIFNLMSFACTLKEQNDMMVSARRQFKIIKLFVYPKELSLKSL